MATDGGYRTVAFGAVRPVAFPVVNELCVDYEPSGYFPGCVFVSWFNSLHFLHA